MTQEQLKEMRERVLHLHKFLRIEDRMIKMEDSRQMTLSPGFWDDNARATSILKEIKIDKYWTDLYLEAHNLVEDSAVLFDFWKAGEATEEEVKEAYQHALKVLEDLEFKSTLDKPEDEMPAILLINSGAGGTESQDWGE